MDRPADRVGGRADSVFIVVLGFDSVGVENDNDIIG